MQRLHSERTAVFGADRHGFRLNRPLPESQVADFEGQHGILLPSDYRQFITAIGNGGAGPYYGIFPLGRMDDTSSDLQPWSAGDGFVGRLSSPFPLRGAWNDLGGKPPAPLLDADDEEYERRFDLFEESYWNSDHVSGAIPICHMGCALRVWLVVSGEEAGHVWRDGRADYTGLSPICTRDGSKAAFGAWYMEWLEDCFRAPPDRRSWFENLFQ